MKSGEIVQIKSSNNGDVRSGIFKVEFGQSTFGPYKHIFTRESLYFDEKENERGSYFFPLKGKTFDNTEIFLETNDIVICIGERGSFSGEAKNFLEVVNLKTKSKYRFYPDEVSLIYNTKEEIVIHYMKGEIYKALSLSMKTLEKVSEKSQKISAFFKLLYNHSTKKFQRLVYHSNSRSHTAGYFIQEDVSSEYSYVPFFFLRKNFILVVRDSISKIEERIDVWEASLTGTL